TQRPSGAVSPAVRANTSIRVALRVEDDADAIDVVGSVEPARIDRRSPGRGFARFGPGAVVGFDTALAGITTSEDQRDLVRPFEFGPGPDVVSAVSREEGLGPLVEAIAEAAKQTRCRLSGPPWCPPLPARLTLDDLPSSGETAAG